ncbi:MAG TPA: DUF5672 family protein [Blastocatellia bacterium]|nr:DUF5672 family protein [Blastocatellia bacterium]
MMSVLKFPTRKTKKVVAVVVPLSNREELLPEEEISFTHLERYLGRYDRYLVAPRSLEVNYPGFAIKRFSDSYFGSVKAHSRLMLSPAFYEEFSDYRYILTYHLDALVFSDQLLEWCATDLDFIGAPRLANSDRPCVVGNGGFALRKVESFLKVLYSTKYAVDPDTYWERFCAGRPTYSHYLNLPRKYLKRLRIFNNISRDIHLCLQADSHYEDIFISENAVKYYPEFKIAPLEVALRFAFDEVPRMCFEMNNYRLPFGCHAWHKSDRAFWEPYLIKEVSPSVRGGLGTGRR